jgi:hypothetical protein
MDVLLGWATAGLEVTELPEVLDAVLLNLVRNCW